MGLTIRFLFWFSLAKEFAVYSMEHRYGLTGGPIQFYIDRNQSTVIWRRSVNPLSGDQLLVNSEGVSPLHKKKVKLNSDKSLTINNLQKNDSGTYRALTIWEDTTLAEYMLTVEDEVSEPKIASYNYDLSTGGCRTSVNCSADGSWAAYDCDLSDCSQTHVSLNFINITVSVLDSRVVQCEAYNHVSNNKSTITIMCKQKQTNSPRFAYWIVLATCAGVVLSFLCGWMVMLFKKKRSSKVYPQSSSAGVDGSANEQSPETIYSTVQKPNTFQTTTGNPSYSNIDTTIYDTPSKHPRVHQADSVGVDQEQQRPQEDGSVKVTATVHQAAEPDSEQINTVYSTLQ